MTRVRWVCSIAFCMAVTVSLTGCRPQREPSEDEVLYYLRNARLMHYRTGQSAGQVRRLWPKGQEYVDEVLKADADLQKSLKSLRQLTRPLSLWPADDPQWRDVKLVQEKLTEVVSLLEVESAKRRALLEVLSKAIKGVPDDLSLADSAKIEAFTDAVWEALRIHGAGLRDSEVVSSLEEVVRLRRQLLEAAKAGSDAFEPEQTGLTFKDPQRQQVVEELHEQLRSLLADHREDFRRYAQEQLARIAVLLQGQDEDPRNLSYTYLQNRRRYFLEELEDISKEYTEHIKQHEEKHKRLKRSVDELEPGKRAEIDRKVAFHEWRIAQLRSEQESWDERAKRIKQETALVAAESLPDGNEP